MSQQSTSPVREKVRFTFPAVKVLSVTERKTPGSSIVVDDKYQPGPEVSLGWFVRWDESSAIFMGMEKPDIQPGDMLQLTAVRFR